MSVKDELLSGEEIVQTTEKHWVAPLRDSLIPILLLIGAYLIGVISPNDQSGLFGFVGSALDLLRTGMVVVAVVWIGYNIVVWRTAVFVVTNRRVIREEGLISRRSSATILATVTDVQSRVPALGGPLGYGDLVIFTQSGEAGADRFKTIAHPKAFRDKVLEIKLGSDSPAAPAPVATGPVAAPAPTAAPAPVPTAAPTSAAAPPPPSSEAQLQTLARLAELRDSGAITPEEYEAKKTELLARI